MRDTTYIDENGTLIPVSNLDESVILCCLDSELDVEDDGTANGELSSEEWVKLRLKIELIIRRLEL